MASLNKVLIIGNLGADPEVRYSANGDAIANLRVATTESWKDKNSGEKKEATEWHRVVLYRKLAEIAGQYLKKGSQVYLEGKIQTRKWQNKDGVDQYTTEIVATEMKMLGGRGGNDAGDGDNGGYQRQQGGQQQGGQQRQQGGGQQQGGGNQQNNPNPGKKPGAWDDLGDDIPF